MNLKFHWVDSKLNPTAGLQWLRRKVNDSISLLIFSSKKRINYSWKWFVVIGRTRESYLKRDVWHTYIHTYIHKLYFISNLRVAFVANFSERKLTNSKIWQQKIHNNIIKYNSVQYLQLKAKIKYIYLLNILKCDIKIKFYKML